MKTTTTKTLLLTLLIGFCFSINAQNVNIPDAIFKAALLSNQMINTNQDGEIQVSEAAAYTGDIEVGGMGITDMTGIEAFTGITGLGCSSNQLGTLNVSANVNLTWLHCSSAFLTSLDVSNNTLLDDLYCATNNLTSLDVSNNPLLTQLGCGQTGITTLNLTQNTLLNYIYASFAQLSSIQFCNNTPIATLICDNNQLTNLVIDGDSLQTLICAGNQLTSLNLSNHTRLSNLHCGSNQLSSLNIQNGNNSILGGFVATNNPSLTCIQVDDVTFMDANWSGGKDAGANFNTDCSNIWCTITIPDANFKAALVANSAINTNGDGEIQCSEAADFGGTIDVSNSGISSLVGIEAFTNITTLDCSGNPSMSGLDVTSNTSLTHLFCQGNNITTLNTINNLALIELNCNNNNMTLPNVGLNTNLQILNCGQNSISSLDLSALNSLTQLICNACGITYLNIQNGNNINLITFNATGNSFACAQADDPTYMDSNWASAIDAGVSYSTFCALPCNVTIPDANFKAALLANSAINTNSDGEIQCSEAAAFGGNLFLNNLNISDLTGIEAFTNLTLLECKYNQLTTLDVSSNSALQTLVCTGNLLTVLDVSENTALVTLEFHNNQVASINVSNSSLLQNLYCNSNQLTAIDVSAIPGLLRLSCSNNLLTSIDVSANTALIHLDVRLNQLTALDVSNNPLIGEFYCAQNQLSSIDVSNFTNLGVFYSYNNPSLTSINLQNGNNTAITDFNSVNCPLLYCVQVDNLTYSNAATGWIKDASAVYSTNCSCNANITGTATYSLGNVSEGYAVLYSINATQQLDSINIKALDVNGGFDFPFVNQGDYVVRILPNAGSYPTLVNTYYENKFLWDSATVINHICGVTNALGNNQMIEMTGTVGGTANISGTLIQGPGFERNIGDPVPGADIKLGRNPQGTIVASTTTDNGGNYQFTNVDIGSYTIYVDIPGYFRDSSYTVTVDAGNNAYNNLNYVVDSNTVFIDFTSGLSNQNKPSLSNDVTVFPNPITENTFIEYDLSESGLVQIYLYDMLGKKVETIVNTNQIKGKQRIILNSTALKLNAGLYLLNLITEQKIVSKKIVIR
jgi:Leucine-rich repeat (LRR) protein